VEASVPIDVRDRGFFYAQNESPKQKILDWIIKSHRIGSVTNTYGRKHKK